MAEFAVVPAEQCFKIPDVMAFDEAAAMLMTYGTSHYALRRRANLQQGETLLVLGAAGGVGIAAVELGKAMGARVIGAVSSPEKAALVRAQGADEVVVYARGSFDKSGAKALTEQFKAACGANGANVIYDAVGGDYAEPALRSIAWEGRYLVVGFPAGIPKIPLNLALLKSCQIVGVYYGAAITRDPQAYREQIRELFEMRVRGAIKPTITERFPLARGGEAIARLATREAKGKIVVTMQ
jgi:NADPH2:quinone reductase